MHYPNNWRRIKGTFINATLLIGLLWGAASSLSAATENSDLRLQEALIQSLENNLDLALQRTDTAISEEQTIISDAAFDPRLSLNTRYGENKNPIASSTLTGANRLQTDNANYDAQVSKEIKGTGTQLSVSTALNRSKTNSSNATINPDISTEVGISISQPLLKGAGTINLAPLARARARSRIAFLQLQQNILNLIEATENNYWQLAAEVERLRLRQSSHTLAQNFLDETENRRNLGLATEAEVLQAKAQLASQEEALLANRLAVENASDRLRQVMGILELSDTQSFSPEPLPTVIPEIPELELAWEKTLATHADYHIRFAEMMIQEIDTNVARNNRLPQLNLILNGAYLGRDRDAQESYNNTVEREAYRWSTGLQLSFPWGRRAEFAEYRIAQKRLQRAETRLEQTRMDMLLDVRNAWRGLKTSIERQKSADANLQFTREAFEQQTARYREGLASFRDTLEAQRDLDNAHIRALESRLNVNQSKITLARLQGTLLESNGFTWQELKAEP